MKKLIALAAATAAVVGTAAPGIAQTYSPAGTTIQLASVGTVRVSKGSTVFNCTLTGQGAISADGRTAQLNNLAFSGSNICASIRFAGLPYFVSASSLTVATLNNVRVTSLLGSCQGNVTASFNQSNGQITFNNAPIPTSDGGGGCTITGTVSTTPAASYTLP